MSHTKRMARLHKNEKHQWPTLIMTVVIGTMSVDSFATQEGKAEIVEAYGTLTLKKKQKTEVGDCHFIQTFGNFQIWMGERWELDLPASELGKRYQRDNQLTQISFSSKGQYTLIINQSTNRTDKINYIKGVEKTSKVNKTVQSRKAS